MKHLIIISIAIVAFLGLPGLAQAQWSVGPHVIISVPNSDFANVSGVGGGFGVKGVRQMGGVFAVRGDFAFISHGRELASLNFGGFITPAEIKNESYRMTLGPELSTGGRHLRVHAEVAGGFYIFRTSLTDSFGRQFDSNTDGAWGWNAGAGVQYDIGLGPWLDVSLEYQSIYNITTELEDDQGQTAKQDIDANEFTIKAGVIFFLD